MEALGARGGVTASAPAGLARRAAAVRANPGALTPIVGGVVLAALAGALAGNGEWALAAAVVGVPAAATSAISAPERTALASIVVLPFLVYTGGIGAYSIFLAVPLFGLTSLTLLMRRSGSISRLRRTLPIASFGLLVGIALVMAAVSVEPGTALSRAFYLFLFGMFAFAVAAALGDGRLSAEAIAKAMLYSGALAGLATLIQFMAQFTAGRDAVIEWLHGQHALFASARTAAEQDPGWTLVEPELVRGVFPFMTPASAGQYLMLPLVAGIWLRWGRGARAGPESKLQMVLILIVAAALLITFSRQSWLGAAAGIVALALWRRPGFVVAIGAAFLVALVVPIPGAGGTFGGYLLTAADTTTVSTETRLELWRHGLELVPEHAFIGVGPGLVETLNPDPDGALPFGLDNVFLDSAVELGIAGAAALLAVFLVGLRNARRRSASLAFALIAAYLVASEFDNVFYFPRNGLMLALAFALIAAPTAASSRPRGS